MVLGEKRLETRSWATGHRGPLAIHAAARVPPHARAFMDDSEAFRQVAGRRRIDPAHLPLGAVLGIVRVLDCLPAETALRELAPGAQELAFGDFTPGRHAWLLEVVRAFNAPVPARGALGLWTWDAP